MNDTNRPNTTIPATTALAELGTSALPPLLAVVTNTHHPAQITALGAVLRIADLGHAQQVVPVVANFLTSTNNDTAQMLAITILGKLNAAPEISVPALASCLKSSSPAVRLYSANTLAGFGSQASDAVPALTNALTDPDPLTRKQAAWALSQIAPATFTNASPQ
jgi:HEAT repeat protein